MESRSNGANALWMTMPQTSFVLLCDFVGTGKVSTKLSLSTKCLLWISTAIFPNQIVISHNAMNCKLRLISYQSEIRRVDEDMLSSKQSLQTSTHTTTSHDELSRILNSSHNVLLLFEVVLWSGSFECFCDLHEAKESNFFFYERRYQIHSMVNYQTG